MDYIDIKKLTLDELVGVVSLGEVIAVQLLDQLQGALVVTVVVVARSGQVVAVNGGMMQPSMS